MVKTKKLLPILALLGMSTGNIVTVQASLQTTPGTPQGPVGGIALATTAAASEAADQALIQETAKAMAQQTLEARVRSLNKEVEQVGNRPVSAKAQDAYATAAQQLFDGRTEEQAATKTKTSSTRKKELASKEKRTKAKSRKTPATKRVDPGSKSGTTKGKNNKLKTKKAQQ